MSDAGEDQKYIKKEKFINFIRSSLQSFSQKCCPFIVTKWKTTSIVPYHPSFGDFPTKFKKEFRALRFKFEFRDFIILKFNILGKKLNPQDWFTKNEIDYSKNIKISFQYLLLEECDRIPWLEYGFSSTTTIEEDSLFIRHTPI